MDRRAEPATGSRRFPVRSWIAAALLLMVVAGAVILLAGRGPDAGPLAGAAPGCSMEGATRAPGQPVSFGIISFGHAHLSSPAVFESVQPVSLPPGLRVLGYYVVRTDVSAGIGAMDGFPPPGYRAYHLAGYSFVGEARPVMIAVGLTATRPGVFVIPGFTLRYRIGSSRYQASYRAGASIRTTPGQGPDLQC